MIQALSMEAGTYFFDVCNVVQGHPRRGSKMDKVACTCFKYLQVDGQERLAGGGAHMYEHGQTESFCVFGLQVAVLILKSWPHFVSL